MSEGSVAAYLSDAQIMAMLNDTGGALRDLDRVDCEESLSSFIRRGWSQIEPSTPYKYGWHIDAISDHLGAVTDGHIQKLLINVPPGTLKSLSTSVFWPAWEWGPRNMPGNRVIGTSYSERYSIRDNGRMRNLVTSDWYRERWGDRVRLIKDGERSFENSAHGWRQAIPFSGLTSGRADRLIIDDPHSTESAESEGKRETTIRIFLESVPTRLNDPEKSAIVIIMQRLHEEDVSGVAISRDLGYTHLNLPMEYDPSRHCVTYYPGTDLVLFEDPRTEDGELLFPDRFPAKVVEGYRSTLGPYAYAGQMQQMPVPRGGGIFQWDWWELWGNPDDSEDPVFKRFPTCEYVVASLDGAYTEKEQNDFSALTVWGVFRENLPTISGTKMSRSQQRAYGAPKVMLMAAWQKRLPLHGEEPPPREPDESTYHYRQRCMKVWGLVEWVADTCDRFGVNKLLIEAKGPGISVGQEIKRLHSGKGWGVQLLDPGRQDKVARAYSVQPLFADHMVFAPDREWAEMVKTQMSTFPRATNDDLVDSATQALKHLRDLGLLMHATEMDRELHGSMLHTGSVAKPLYPV